MSKTALFAGSFDPFTIGHKSIVDRSRGLFDRIIIGVGVNPSKSGWLTVDERVKRIREAFRDDDGIEVICFSGLTTDAAREAGAEYLLRGVRTVADFEFERQLADINRSLTGIESVLVFSLPEHSSISSSAVRELASHGADITTYIP